VSKIVLGIDPGFSVTGFGIVKKQEGKAFLIDCGALSLNARHSLPLRIQEFYSFFSKKIIDYQVTGLAIETPFLGKNAQNFLKLGYLRGILYLLAAQHGLVLYEFSPRQVKVALTGFGGADKEQVARMILRFFPALIMPNKFDITDALAITLCGLWENSLLISALKS
jgi:crossover junction endodeoxyribonuclease RuvC